MTCCSSRLYAGKRRYEEDEVDGIDAGRLIAFATDVTAAPGDSGERAEYARLAGRYLSDAAFRMLVDDILEGVGCEVTAEPVKLNGTSGCLCGLR